MKFYTIAAIVSALGAILAIALPQYTVVEGILALILAALFLILAQMNEIEHWLWVLSKK